MGLPISSKVSTISTDSALTRLPLAVYARFKSVNLKKYILQTKNIILAGAPTGGGSGPWPPGHCKSGTVGLGVVTLTVSDSVTMDYAS